MTQVIGIVPTGCFIRGISYLNPKAMTLLRKKPKKTPWQYRLTHPKKDELMRIGALATVVVGAVFLLERYSERFFLLD